MNQIDLGNGFGCKATGNSATISLSIEGMSCPQFLTLTSQQMDALCDWWHGQRERQAIESHEAGRSRTIEEIASDLRKGRRLIDRPDHRNDNKYQFVTGFTGGAETCVHLSRDEISERCREQLGPGVLVDDGVDLWWEQP